MGQGERQNAAIAFSDFREARLEGVLKAHQGIARSPRTRAAMGFHQIVRVAALMGSKQVHRHGRDQGSRQHK